MTWLKSTGLDVLAHAAVAAVLAALFGAWPLVAALFYVREWSQEQGKTGDYSITNAWMRASRGRPGFSLATPQPLPAENVIDPASKLVSD